MRIGYVGMMIVVMMTLVSCARHSSHHQVCNGPDVQYSQEYFENGVFEISVFKGKTASALSDFTAHHHDQTIISVVNDPLDTQALIIKTDQII